MKMTLFKYLEIVEVKRTGADPLANNVMSNKDSLKLKLVLLNTGRIIDPIDIKCSLQSLISQQGTYPTLV